MATPVSNSSFDVEAYIGNYQGFTRLKRMAFIASQNSTLKPDVLRVAIDEVRKTTNTALYLELITMAADTPGASARDDAWVEAEDKRASQRLEKLENDLSQHKTSLVKESIRVRACHTHRLAAMARLWADPRRTARRAAQMGHNDLGDFHSARGDFATALKCYVRTRDYCTTSKHIITMCLNIIRVSIHMGNFSHVANYITKAESTDSSGSDPVLMAQLRVSAGLAHLEAKKYRLAARKMLETNPELGSSFSEIVSPQARSAPHLGTGLRLRTPPAPCPVPPAPHPPCESAPPLDASAAPCTASAPPCTASAPPCTAAPLRAALSQDVATYGALCALASFDRAELKAKVIDNINFRSFLELVPEVPRRTPSAPP